MILSLLLVACGPSDTLVSEYHEDLLPREEQIRINLPVDGASAKGFGDEENGFARYYATTREVTEHVNGLITFVLGTVGYVVTLEPSWSDADERQAVWGPYQDSGLDPVSTGLWVREEDDGSYSWAIFQVPNGSEEEIAIVAGTVDAGATPDDASGKFAVDFETASSLDPAVNLQGTFYVEYAYDPEGVAAVAGFDDYGVVGFERYDALYAYDEDFTGAGEMDLAWLSNVDGRPSEEVLTMHSRWQEDGEGRSDATAGGGDLGDTVVTANECWGTTFGEVFWTDTVGLYAAVGDESACAFIGAEYATGASFAIVE